MKSDHIRVEAMTVSFRILKDKQGYSRVWQIVDGCVAELTPLPEDEKREPGIYDADYNLLKSDSPPWKAKQREGGTSRDL